MADVIRVPGLGEQLRLIQRLRWWLFRNRLRTASARLGLLGSILIGLLYAYLSLGVGVGIGVGSFALAQRGQLGYFDAILWGIFLFWQVFPVVTMQAGGGFDSRSLLRFPLRLSSYCALNVAQGFADPIALCGMFWHFCLWLGVTCARPDAWWSFAITLGLSIAVNVLFGQMTAAWTERLLAQRRTREFALALFILGMISLQFARASIGNAAGPVAEFLHRTSAVWAALPPGQTGAAVRQALGGQGGAMLLAWVGLAAYATVFALLLMQRLRAEYSGEYFSETAVPGSEARVVKARTPVTPVSSEASGRMDWLAGPVGAVFLKETKYLYRNSVLAIGLLVPLILVGFLSANQKFSQHGFFGPARSEYAYPGLMAYMAFILMPRFSMNSLGLDGGGIQLLFLTPVPFRQVMLGKNVFLGALLATEATLAWGVMSLLARPPSLLVVALTWTGLVFVALVGMSLGNWLSLRFPQKMEFGMRNQRASAWPSLLYMLTLMASIGLLAGIATLGAWLVGDWLVLVAYVVLDVAAVLVYRATLETTTAQAIRRRETIIEQLVR